MKEILAYGSHLRKGKHSCLKYKEYKISHLSSLPVHQKPRALSAQKQDIYFLGPVNYYSEVLRHVPPHSKIPLSQVALEIATPRKQ